MEASPSRSAIGWLRFETPRSPNRRRAAAERDARLEGGYEFQLLLASYWLVRKEGRGRGRGSAFPPTEGSAHFLPSA